MSSTCRTCGEQKDLINIFDTGSTIADKLMSIANIQVRI